MKQQIHELLAAALAALPELGAAGLVPDVERTRDPRHGDFASNVALKLAGPLGAKPRDVAARIVAALPPSESIAGIEIAGPGFINFRLAPAAWQRELERIITAGDRYGRSELGGGQRVHVEFVSANPTGPLHVGHGRHAAHGATVANLLAATGHRVHREYYVNDAGRQMDILAVSVWLRLLEQAGADVPFPTSGYHGAYIRDIAAAAAGALGAEFRAEPGAIFTDLPADAPDGDADRYLDALIARARELIGEARFARVLRIAVDSILGDIRDDLAGFGVEYDEWFSEQGLVDAGAVDRALARVGAAGKTYVDGGATWFRATDYGDEKDRVVVRENGRKTYFASDIAYHLHKRERGFERLIDILGADHHGYVARVRAGLAAMGEPPECLEVDLVQFVVLYRGSEKVQMSTRSGEFVTLRALREEVGDDAARLFFVSRSNDQHLDFDLELAKSRSNENPVYYIQYAHARVCSVMRELETRGLDWDATRAAAAADRLVEPQEAALMQSLSRYPEIVELAARQRAPQHVVHYLRELAHGLHTWYNAHRFLVEDAAVRDARVLLALATRQVLRNGLGLLGVSAPASM